MLGNIQIQITRNIYICEKQHFVKWSFLSTEHLAQTIWSILVGFLKLAYEAYQHKG